MTQQENINFNRISKAIEYITLNFKEQPSLNQIAESVNLSPYHFQRLFKDWAGVSPKKFMQYISVEYAKSLLKEQGISVLDTAYQTGLSGASRLHDLFINIEGMTPGEFKNGGKNLHINYSFGDSHFGDLIVASTKKGICYLAFLENQTEALEKLKTRFPNAQYHQVVDAIQLNALLIFKHGWNKLNEIKLHLKGTSFQLKVWEALLKIPKGNLSTYGEIAKHIDKPKASRAVGTAIGNNPIAFLIPCHRVIQSTGNIGGYRWGNTRKIAMIGWEASKTKS